MAKIHVVGTALVAAALVAGCTKSEAPAPAEKSSDTDAAVAPAAAPEKDPKEVVISVSGKNLTRGEIDRQVDAIIAKLGEKIPAEQLPYQRSMYASQIAQSFVIDNAFVAKAAELGYKVDDKDVKEFEDKVLKQYEGRPNAPKTIDELLANAPFEKSFILNQFKSQALLEKMIEGEVTSKNKKDYTAEAQKVIDEIKEKNAKIPELSAEALKKINELKATLDATPDEEKAAKFAELAKENSDCPSAARGGDLGPFTHGQMVAEFDEAAFKLPVGAISDVVKTQFGYHLILVTDKKAATEAQGETPAEPETVTASHILVKAQTEEPVPELDDVVKYFKSRDERVLASNFMSDILRKSGMTAASEYSFLLPAPEPEAEAPAAPEEAAEEKTEKTVENPAEK